MMSLLKPQKQNTSNVLQTSITGMDIISSKE